MPSGRSDSATFVHERHLDPALRLPPDRWPARSSTDSDSGRSGNPSPKLGALQPPGQWGGRRWRFSITCHLSLSSGTGIGALLINHAEYLNAKVELRIYEWPGWAEESGVSVKLLPGRPEVGHQLPVSVVRESMDHF